MIIEASQRMLKVNSQGRVLGGMSPPQKRHLELEIRTLKNAPRCRQIGRLLQIKQRQKEEAMYMEDTHRLATEIEILKVVLYLVMSEKEQRIESFVQLLD